MSEWDIRREALARLGFGCYADYLASPLWKRIKQRVFERDKKICVCGRPAHQVHHRQYEYRELSGESLFWLVSLCVRCHRKVSYNSYGNIREPHEGEGMLRACGRKKVESTSKKKKRPKGKKSARRKAHRALVRKLMGQAGSAEVPGCRFVR